MLALQALHKARSLDCTSSELFTRLVDFDNRSFDDATTTDVVLTVLVEEAPELLGMQPVQDFVLKTAASIRDEPLTSLPMRIAVTKALIDKKISSVEESCALIVDGGLDSREVTVETCRDATSYLASLGDDAATCLAKWFELVQERFPN